MVRTEFPEDIVNTPIKIREGTATTVMKSPDSITTYKLFVLVCTENSFGVVELEVLVRNPVFTATLNPPEMVLGDQLAIPTVVENLSAKTLKGLRLTARPNDCLQLLENSLIELGNLLPDICVPFAHVLKTLPGEV